MDIPNRCFQICIIFYCLRRKTILKIFPDMTMATIEVLGITDP